MIYVPTILALFGCSSKDNQEYKKTEILTNILVANSIDSNSLTQNQKKAQFTLELKIKDLESKNYKEAIKEVKTPEEDTAYCLYFLKYFPEKADTFSSFKEIHKKKIDDCDGGAYTAAALLSDNGHPLKVLTLADSTKNGHMLFLYENKRGGFGTIGIFPADNIPATNKNINEIIQIYNERTGKNYTEYKIFGISEKQKDFISGKGKPAFDLEEQSGNKLKKTKIKEKDIMIILRLC